MEFIVNKIPWYIMIMARMKFSTMNNKKKLLEK